MTTHEKIYLGFVVLFNLFLFLICVYDVFMYALSLVETDDISLWIGFAFFLLLALGLCATTAIILHNRTQLTTPFAIQCGILALSCYGIPLATWGCLVLRNRIRRESKRGSLPREVALSRSDDKLLAAQQATKPES